MKKTTLFWKNFLTQLFVSVTLLGTSFVTSSILFTIFTIIYQVVNKKLDFSLLHFFLLMSGTIWLLLEIYTAIGAIHILIKDRKEEKVEYIDNPFLTQE